MRVQIFLLALIFIGVFCCCSGTRLLSSRSHNFAIPHHNDDTSSSSADPATPTDEILLVSAFLPLNQAHHSDEEHKKRPGSFLGTIRTPIYFFILPLVRNQRVVTHYHRLFLSNPFDVPPVQGLYDIYTKCIDTIGSERRGTRPIRSEDLKTVIPPRDDEKLRGQVRIQKQIHRVRSISEASKMV